MIPAVLGLVAARQPEATGLRFDRLGGPVAVVCGLHGGVGTSTLAHALARQAASESPCLVLLAETDASAGDQKALTGAESSMSLSGLGVEFLAGRKAPPFVEVDGLRVIATKPGSGSGRGVSEVVVAAGAMHGLVVIDGGQIRAPGTRQLLRVASHVLWVTTARTGAADRGRALLATAGALSARQMLVVRKGDGGRTAQAELRKLAEELCDRLVFWSDDLTALAGFLRE